MQRGTEVVLTAGGEFSQWPPKVAISYGELEITPVQIKGKLQAEAPADAAPGLYLVRLYDSSGASAARPLLVGHVPEQLESEANDSLAEANQIDPPTVINGRLQSKGDVDTFRVPLKRGETLVASLAAHRPLGSPMDATLQFCTGDGHVLAHNDDARGLDPQLAFTAPSDGIYCVRLFAFPEKPNSTIAFAGGEDFVYRLTLTTGGFVDHALPLAVASKGPRQVQLFGFDLPKPLDVSAALAPTGIPATAFHADHAGWALLAHAEQTPVVYPRPSSTTGVAESPRDELPITLPATVSGRIEKAGTRHVLRFEGKKGQRLTAAVASHGLGFPLDPVLELLDAEGKSLATADDQRETRDPVLQRTIPADGEYRLVLRDTHDRGGLRYVYRLAVKFAEPDFSLSVAEDTYLLASGGKVEVPITVNRQAGYAESIELRAEGLPPEVEFEPVVSEGKGATAKAVKLTLRARKTSGSATPVHATFRVVGRAASDAPLEREATCAILGGLARRSELWMTVTAAK